MYASDLKHPDQNLEDKLHQLYSLNRNKVIDLSFRPPFLELLEAFGNPHLNLPPVIHVAGTNGKGSIIAMARSILETAGYKVHAYTSPHLIRFNERIVLAGELIEDGPLEDLIDEALQLNAGGDLTFFEITTAIAFAAFARTPADICLLEVGMGGRLDCTNVIENPLVTIIGAIGNDHGEYLGETLSEIAGEKAGILKPGVPCVIGRQPHNEIMSVLENKAAELNAPLHHAEQPCKTALIGPHQTHNAAAALTALGLIKSDFPVSPDQIEKGLETVSWPARLQRLNPANFEMDKDCALYLDGGHNADAGLALAKQAELWQQGGKKLSVILAMMNGKDCEGFLEPLQPLIDHLYVVNIENEPQSQSAQGLHRLFPESEACLNVDDALAKIKEQDRPPQRILICGSLYLAGHVLKRAAK